MRVYFLQFLKVSEIFKLSMVNKSMREIIDPGKVSGVKSNHFKRIAAKHQFKDQNIDDLDGN